MLSSAGCPIPEPNSAYPDMRWSVEAFAEKIWLPELKKNRAGWRLSEQVFRRRIQPFLGSLALTSLAEGDIQVWINQLRRQAMAPATRNRVLFVFNSLLKMAGDSHLTRIADAPLRLFLKKHLSRQQRKDRVRIEADKLRLLWQRLGQSHSTCARIIELLFLTGAAKSEILSARWEKLDLDRRELTLAGRNGKMRKIWLGPQAVAIFAGLPRRGDSPWIFPGQKAEKHLSDIFLFWDDLRKTCGMPGLRIQDLRNNYKDWRREDYSPAIESVVGKKSSFLQSGDERTPAIRIVAFSSLAAGSPEQKFSIRPLLRDLTEKFLASRPAGFARTGCAIFFGMDAKVQRDFLLATCLDSLAGGDKRQLPPSPAAFLKKCLRISGVAVNLESGTLPFPQALRQARASLRDGNGNMAIAGGIERTGAASWNSCLALLTVGNGSDSGIPLAEFATLLDAPDMKTRAAKNPGSDDGISAFGRRFAELSASDRSGTETEKENEKVADASLELMDELR